jgi:hypothetical protein
MPISMEDLHTERLAHRFILHALMMQLAGALGTTEVIDRTNKTAKQLSEGVDDKHRDAVEALIDKLVPTGLQIKFTDDGDQS